jgi:HSP20 family protein
MKTGDGGLGGLLKGLGDLVEKLGELEKSGRDLAREGSIEDASGKVHGRYGVQIRVGGLKGTSSPPKADTVREAPVHEVREPDLDIFEEPGEIVLVGEMPGVEPAAVELSLDHDLLTIEAEGRGRRFRKEIHLPAPIRVDSIRISAKNGVIEIRCPR